MNYVPQVEIEYIKDASSISDKRTEDVAELIFQMILVSRKRGRPSKYTDMEVSDAA